MRNFINTRRKCRILSKCFIIQFTPTLKLTYPFDILFYEIIQTNKTVRLCGECSLVDDRWNVDSGLADAPAFDWIIKQN